MSDNLAHRRRAPATILGVAFSVALGLAAQTPQRPVFRAGTNLVVVDAYPRRNGRIVEGLTAEDFELFEDGKPQKIEQVDFVRASATGGERTEATSSEARALASEGKSRVFVMFLDVLHVTAQESRDMHAPLVTLLDGVLGSRDLFAVATSKQPTDLQFGRALLTMVDALGGLGTWGERDGRIPDPKVAAEKDIAGCFEKPVADGLIARLRMDRTLTSLEQTVNFLAHTRETRTFIVVVSAGWSLAPAPGRVVEELSKAQMRGRPGVGVVGGRIGTVDQGAGRLLPCDREAYQAATLDLDARFRDLIERASHSNIAVYPVTPGVLRGRSLPGRSDMAPVGDEPLITLAHNTDGEALIRPEQLAKGLSAAGPDISAYYLLGYVSPSTASDGQYHAIRVRVKQPRVSVSARPGFQSPTAAEAAINAKINAPPVELPPGIGEALGRVGRAAPDTALLIDAVTWGEGGDLIVTVELGPAIAAKGKWGQGADVRVSAVGDRADRPVTGSGRIDAGAHATVVRLHPDADAAVWRVSVRAIGADGEVSDRLAASGSRGTWLGDPLLFRVTGPAVAPQPVIDPVFRRTERVHIEWPVLSPIDHHTARLLNDSGDPVALPVSISEATRFDRPSLVADLTLSPLAPGDYVIEVTTGKGTDSDKTLVAIRIAR